MSKLGRARLSSGELGDKRASSLFRILPRPRLPRRGRPARGGPPISPLFCNFFAKLNLLLHTFFAFFPILDVSGRVSDAQNHGSMDSSIMDLANEYLISPLAISSSPLWRFQRKSILGQLLKNSAQNGPPEQTDGRTDGRTDREQPRASEPGSTQGIFIPWMLAAPLQ